MWPNPQCIGYRQITKFISLKYGINIAKEDARKSLLLLDSVEIEKKKRKVVNRRVCESSGPMNTLHINSNDKLKKFGFSIHGCIDGFSRESMWLIVSTSNNDPLVIANLFLSIQKHRKDCGRENIYCEDMQVFFIASEESFIYAKSTRNQRIESFRSRLKKYKLN